MRYLISLISIFFTTSSFGQTLVLPGDFPDPSVVKVGDSYWATATTSNWAPAFPILESKDLVRWELRGHVFPELPEWADYYFWAPEISYDNGRVYVYYSAHKRGGNLCTGVASAARPEGPYTDHGPLICQEVGSIDAWPMRDKSGKLYLIWKEDGNSRKLPTSIWAAEMNEARTALSDDRKELFRNDAPWENNLVEGVSMIRHGKYIYAFYAGAGCCGRACSYGVGLARATDLLGPWEKYSGNPILATGEDWQCPGHGTPIVKDGKYYFLYHAYDKEDNVYAGRQGVLSEFTFTEDGWIELVDGPGGHASIQREVDEQFSGNKLSDEWQWSVFNRPRYTQKDGKLELMASDGKAGSFLAYKTLSADYDAEAILVREVSSAEAGVGLIGDEKNFVAVTLKNNVLVLRKVEADRETVIEEKQLGKDELLYLRLEVRGGKNISVYYSADGKEFSILNQSPVDGFFLPPWDRAVRAALISKGDNSEKAVFDRFTMKNN
jgi:xylan 1,4-beta-xylosidase